MNKPAHLDMAAWEPTPNNLEAFFMGFTPNEAFKKRPRLIARAKDMHYYDMKGRALIDASAGLWCFHSPCIFLKIIMNTPSASPTVLFK